MPSTSNPLFGPRLSSKHFFNFGISGNREHETDTTVALPPLPKVRLGTSL